MKRTVSVAVGWIVLAGSAFADPLPPVERERPAETRDFTLAPPLAPRPLPADEPADDRDSGNSRLKQEAAEWTLDATEEAIKRYVRRPSPAGQPSAARNPAAPGQAAAESSAATSAADDAVRALEAHPLPPPTHFGDDATRGLRAVGGAGDDFAHGVGIGAGFADDAARGVGGAANFADDAARGLKGAGGFADDAFRGMLRLLGIGGAAAGAGAVTLARRKKK
jgi:hypothetical protein